MTDFRLSQSDVVNVTQITGLDENDIPDAFLSEFENRLALQHRLQSGPMIPAILVQLCRDFGINGVSNDIEDHQNIRWEMVVHDAPVSYRKSPKGKWLPGFYQGGVQGGTIAVRPEDGSAALELKREFVKLRRLRKAVERDEKNLIDRPNEINWYQMPVGQKVKYGGKSAALVSVPPVVDERSPKKLRIKVGSEVKDVPMEDVSVG